MSSNQASQHSRPKLRFVLGAVTVASAASWCAAAHAQSSVTLYGIADVGIEHINNTNTGGAQTREASGNLSGSRWGLKGVEDLGGGMKAISSWKTASTSMTARPRSRRKASVRTPPRRRGFSADRRGSGWRTGASN